MLSDINEKLSSLRRTNTGCDVVLQIGTKSFFAHRVVLMAQIEYFRNMLVMDFREKKELVIPLDPEIVDSTFFEEILNYIYTFEIDFTDENIRPIYRAADYIRFDELTSKVIEHMKSNLTVENVVFYKTVAMEFGLETLKDDCHQYIIRNLSSDIKREQLIPILLIQDLNEILQKLKQTGNLEEMFHYSVDWIAHHKDNSKIKLLDLLKNIPLESLSFDFLKQVSRNDLIRKNIECLNLLFNAFITVTDVHEKGIEEKNELQVEKLNTAIKESDLRHKEDNKLNTEKIDAITEESDSRLEEVNNLKAIINKPRTESLYVIGGSDGTELSSVSEYNGTTRQWTATTPMPSPRTHFGMASIGQKIYVCGGHNGQSMNELTVFDTLTRMWTELTPMKHAKHLCGVAVLNGYIYVAGGTNSTNRLAVVERYTIETDQWSSVAPMTTERSGLELVELNGFLYAIGGHDGSDILNSVERYDPKTDQWSLMNETRNKYQAFGSAVFNGYIYIVGNDKCEVYNPTIDRWTRMSTPSRCEGGRRLTVYNSQLHVIGGRAGEMKGWKGVKTVEVFDMQARVWGTKPDMDVARCFHSVAVVQTIV